MTAEHCRAFRSPDASTAECAGGGLQAAVLLSAFGQYFEAALPAQLGDAEVFRRGRDWLTMEQTGLFGEA